MPHPVIKIEDDAPVQEYMIGNGRRIKQLDFEVYDAYAQPAEQTNLVVKQETADPEVYDESAQPWQTFPAPGQAMQDFQGRVRQPIPPASSSGGNIDGLPLTQSSVQLLQPLLPNENFTTQRRRRVALRREVLATARRHARAVRAERLAEEEEQHQPTAAEIFALCDQTALALAGRVPTRRTPNSSYTRRVRRWNGRFAFARSWCMELVGRLRGTAEWEVGAIVVVLDELREDGRVAVDVLMASGLCWRVG